MAESEVQLELPFEMDSEEAKGLRTKLSSVLSELNSIIQTSLPNDKAAAEKASKLCYAAHIHFYDLSIALKP